MMKEIFTANRTCRTFDESRKISREELCELVECARLAPASANIQPLSYRLVYTQDELDAVQPLTKWAASLPNLELPPKGHRPTAFLVICHDTPKFGSPDRFQRDVGICALAISLAAFDKGLASCMIGSFKGDELRCVLGLADNVVPQLVIAIGAPDEVRRVEDAKDGVVKYYRTEDNVHVVPKRPLSELII